PKRPLGGNSGKAQVERDVLGATGEPPVVVPCIVRPQGVSEKNDATEWLMASLWPVVRFAQRTIWHIRPGFPGHSGLSPANFTSLATLPIEPWHQKASAGSRRMIIGSLLQRRAREKP